MRKNITGIVLAVILAASSLLQAEAASDKKFFKKAAERVWSVRNELFDKNVAIPDSLQKSASAVVLAEYNFVEARYVHNQSITGVTTRTKRTHWMRRLVKLLDSKAVEEFSEFEFGRRERLNAEFYNFGGSDNAFGARIYKPDGQVVDVDLSQAVDVKEGKKDRKKDVVSRKIAIPGLEPGDILEYFDYTEEWVDEFDLPTLDFVPAGKYPVMAYLLEGEFSPELTVEYRVYNGMPSPQRGSNDKGDNGIFLTLSYIDMVKDRDFLREFRQIPFMRLNTLNNTSSLRFYPQSKRRGGLYEHVSTGTIYRDIKYALAASSYDVPLPGRLSSAVKNFRKAHPEATRRQIIDAAWLAAVYLNSIDKNDEPLSDYWLAVIFCDVLKKLDLTDGSDTRVGFINSRSDVPTEMIMSWRQPDFCAIVGDSLYLPSTLEHFLPAEMPGEYQGEKGGAFPGDREALTTLTEPTVFATETSRPTQNKAVTKMNIDINPADNTAQGTVDFTLSGTLKEMGGDLTDFNDWANAVEDYLGIAENKRYKDKKYDAVERGKEVHDQALEIAKGLIGKNVTDVEDVTVGKRGVLPGQPDMEFSMKVKAEDCVSDAGNDLLLHVGRFVGNNKREEGDERQRQLDAFQLSPRQFNITITFAMPAGYKVDPASLDALQMNVSNKYGAYFSSAKTDENGNLTVNIRERYNSYVIPADDWSQYLQISDAAAAFNDAAVLIKKM